MRRQTAVDSHLGRILVFLSAGRCFVALEERQLQQSSHLCLALASRQSLDSTAHPLQIKMQPGCSASAWPQCSHFGSSGASSVAASTISITLVITHRPARAPPIHLIAVIQTKNALPVRNPRRPQKTLGWWRNVAHLRGKRERWRECKLCIPCNQKGAITAMATLDDNWQTKRSTICERTKFISITNY